MSEDRLEAPSSTVEPSTSSAVKDGPRQLDEDLKADIHATYKSLQAAMPGFNTRRSQSRMIAVAARALGNEGGAAACEAPTGCGKSIAYLTAGVPIAQAHKRKLVIATGTVSLQEQLAQRDVPDFLRATGNTSKVVIAKGRGRYACPSRMDELASGTAQEGLGFEEDAGPAPAWPRAPKPGEPALVEQLAKDLSSHRWDGDLDNSKTTIDDDLRPLLTITAGGCTGTRCSYYATCPFFTARRGLKTADIVIANHALLVSDLMLGMGEDEDAGGVLLPKASECLYVVDEAHGLASVARDANAASIHTTSTLRRFTRMKGVMRAAYQALGKQQVSGLSLQDGTDLFDQVQGTMSSLTESITTHWTPEPGEEHPTWRAPLGQLPEPWRDQAEVLASATLEQGRWIKGVKRAVGDDDDIPATTRDTLVREIGILLERINAQAGLWNSWRSNRDGEPVAKWVSLTREGSLVLNASRISAGDFLAETLFKHGSGVLLTSATISTGGDFAHFAHETGLPETAEVVALPSPFDLQTQGTLVVPRIKASPKDRDSHCAESAQWLASELDWGAGNLLLFTSRAKMMKTFEALPASRQALCKVQGSRSRSALLADHAADIASGKGSTLLGMLSYGGDPEPAFQRAH